MKIVNGIVWMMWYLFALFLVILAITVSILHFITPNLDHHRQYIEQWVSRTLNMPVTIKKVEAHWNGIRPEIDLYGVTFHPKKPNSSTSLGTITLDNLHIELNLTKALFALNLQPTGIIADGLNLHVDSTDKGQLSINNLLGSQEKSGVRDVDLSALVAWLQSQSLLVMSNSNIYLKIGGESVERIFIKHLSLLNNGYLHELLATVSHQANTASNIQLGLRVHGDLTKPADLTISSYGHFSNVDFTSWWQQPIAGYQIKRALINGEIWLNWNAGQWKASQSDLSFSGLNLLSLKLNKRIPFDQFSGHVAWMPKESGWQLIGDHLFVVVDQHPWPKTSFSLTEKNNQQQLKIGYVNVTDAQKILHALFKLPKKWTQQLSAMQPTGEFTNIYFEHEGAIHQLDKHFQFVVDVDDLAVEPYQSFPGVSGLDATVTLQPGKGSVNLHSQDLIVNLPKLYSHSITAGNVQAVIHAKQAKNDAWFIDADNIRVINEDAAVVGDVSMQFPTGGDSPVVSMLLGYQEKNPAVIKQYFPDRYFDKEFSDWIKEAFISGKSSSGTFVLRGKLSDFPYTDHRGLFFADTKLNNLRFEYAPGWPVISELTGKLLFRNNTMHASAKHARVYKTDIAKLTADIPALKNPGGSLLTINAAAEGPLTDVFRLLEESPLSKELGGDVKKLTGKGAVKTQLKLRVPLGDPEKVQVDGVAALENIQFTIPAWKMTFNQLQGDLHFTENGLTAQQLTAKFLGFPIFANIAVLDDESEHKITQLNINGKMELAALTKAFNIPAFPKITGVASYDAQINLHADADDASPNRMTLKSNLKGITINMPFPLGKTVNQLLPFDANMIFGESGPINLYVSLKQSDFSTRSVLTFKPVAKDHYQFYSGDIGLGEKEKIAIQDKPGIIVHGYMPNFNWKAWYAFFDLKKQQYQEQRSNPGELPVSFIPRMVDLTFGHLKIFNQVLSPVNIKFYNKPSETYYDLLINSSSLAGNLNIPVDYPKGVLIAKFSRVYLSDNRKKDKAVIKPSKQKIDPAAFPAMNIQIDDFKWGDQVIGGVSFSSVPENHGMLIKQLKFTGNFLAGEVSGAWSLIGGAYHTSASGYLSTQNYTQFSEMLGLHGSLMASTGNVRFLLSWPDAPYHFSVDNVNGNAVVNLGGGSVRVDNAATEAKLNLGRIVSLLSIDNLFTGFSSIAKKGYAFDTMHSEIKLNEGLINLSNTYFNGAVARLDFSGLVDTVTKTVDLILVVTPHVTSSLPIIAGVATLNPLVGVATYVADKLFSPAVNHIVARRFMVTGGFSNLKITPVQVKDQLSQIEQEGIPSR